MLYALVMSVVYLSYLTFISDQLIEILSGLIK